MKPTFFVFIDTVKTGGLRCNRQSLTEGKGAHCDVALDGYWV